MHGRMIAQALDRSRLAGISRGEGRFPREPTRSPRSWVALVYPPAVSSQEVARLGEYRLLEKLGQGGMAMVYRGERSAEAGFVKRVALKRMLPQYRRDPSLLERFAAEARTNARLDHPNLVAVVDFGIEPEPYLVMEFVEGVTLALLLQRLVEQGHPLEVAAACFIGAEAAAGLDHAHRRRDERGTPLGIVHRDVSPQNVLLSNEGAVKVSDFGLVKAADNVVQTGSGVPIGKMSYMAPEQADQHEVDARADVFSLGVVVWECLAMRTLMPPDDPARASRMLKACAFDPPSTYNARVPAALDRIVMGCLQKDLALRTPSAQAVSMQLREVLHELAPGYGRDQLARLLSWVFPERGWSIDEPHETAAQPSREERLSIPQVPAAEVMQRASLPPPGLKNAYATGGAAPDGRTPVTGERRARVRPAKRRSALPWVLVLIGGAAVGLIVLVTLAVLWLTWRAADRAETGAAPVPSTPMAPLGPPLGVQGLTITADVPGARVFLGERELGGAPRRPATARLLHPRRIFGSVPGFVPVPSWTRAGGRSVLELIEEDGRSSLVSTVECDPRTACVLDDDRSIP